MWEQIDQFVEDNGGDQFRTYATQVGSIGCIVMVAGSAGVGTSMTFVPGVKLERHTDELEDTYRLVPATGYGEVPRPFEE